MNDDSDRLYPGSDGEAEGASLPPPPINGTLARRKIWTFRAYHGIGRDGLRVDEWTQQEIGDVFGVNARTVRRWLNNPPLIDELPLSHRQTMFFLTITGRDPTVVLDRYRSDDAEDEDSDDESGPFGDLPDDFDPWTSN